MSRANPAISTAPRVMKGWMWLSLALFALWLVIAGAGHATAADPVARGKYIVESGGCNDCHTPWKMGQHGPEPDLTLYLSGHPAAMKMTPAPALPEGPWLWLVAATNTAFAGPWGISYAANLTPHDSGLGVWNEAMFVKAIRTGKHMGGGRPILPPMPVPAISHLTDADLTAVFAYLRTIAPIENAVPDAEVKP